MNQSTRNHHHNTPEVVVADNRGLTIREIGYHRYPGTPDITDERITRHTFTDRGHAHTSADPRLGQSQINNFEYFTCLSGQPLLTTGVDNGTVLSLSDAAGRPSLEVNAAGVTRTWQYEDENTAGRPLATGEREDSDEVRITERFVYAGNSETERRFNLAGQCIRHYDPAGLVQTDSVSLTGSSLSVTRRLLKDASNPATQADWQGDETSDWNALLDAEVFTTLTTADASGTVLTSTDAKGNVQRVAYDVAGLLKDSWLTLKGEPEQVIVKSLSYSAAGQKLREEHGNGVVTTWSYEPETQRLLGIKTERPAGHAFGTKVLQDLRYNYDPVGNVLKVTNDAEATRYWRNQKVVPENMYVYDSLYQLASATGREMANAAQQGTNLPTPAILLPTDSSAYTNYIRTYHYDTGGNLTRIHHHAPATNNTYTTDMTVSNRSNRAVLNTFTDSPAEVEALFTAGGHQKQLLPGQTLVWTPRGELRHITPVSRDDPASDNEHYRYDTACQRVSKISTQQTSKNMQTQQTLYLPGLELRTRTSGISTKEVLHTITVGEAGRAQVRVLHWERGQPDDIRNNQVRYSYDNLTGSSGLEVDAEGNIISLEEYYPYGGTAILTARSQTEVDYKTHRYSGKERDATGLYYYGYRYYQSWSGRWLSADPAGVVDGLNLYRMVRNNPVTFQDSNGLIHECLSPDCQHTAGTREELRNHVSDNHPDQLDLFDLETTLMLQTAPQRIESATPPRCPSPSANLGGAVINADVASQLMEALEDTPPNPNPPQNILGGGGAVIAHISKQASKAASRVGSAVVSGISSVRSSSVNTPLKNPLSAMKDGFRESMKRSKSTSRSASTPERGGEDMEAKAYANVTGAARKLQKIEERQVDMSNEPSTSSNTTPTLTSRLQSNLKSIFGKASKPNTSLVQSPYSHFSQPGQTIEVCPYCHFSFGAKGIVSHMKHCSNKKN